MYIRHLPNTLPITKLTIKNINVILFTTNMRLKLFGNQYLITYCCIIII